MALYHISEPRPLVAMKTRTALRDVHNTAVLLMVFAALPGAGIDGHALLSTCHGNRAQSSDSTFGTA